MPVICKHLSDAARVGLHAKIRRRSFLVDFRHCRLKEPIALELGNKLLVRNGRLLAALSYNGQIFEVFQQFFVLGDWNNDGCTFAAIVGDVLNRVAHERRLEERALICNRSP